MQTASVIQQSNLTMISFLQHQTTANPEDNLWQSLMIQPAQKVLQKTTVERWWEAVQVSTIKHQWDHTLDVIKSKLWKFHSTKKTKVR